jgi:type IV secretion system protein VirB9
MRGLDGTVTWTFGAGAPEVVCAPLNLCDIELQRGEQILNMSIGDSARWQTQTISGTAPLSPHVIVKPSEVGISTSMIISTDRRTYHVHLVADRTQYTALTRFVYPEELLQQAQAAEKRKAAEEQHLMVPALSAGGAVTADQLDFRYQIDGQAPFRPVRVFNDGTRTIIQLPADLEHEAVPVLLVTNRDAPSTAGQTAAVNYRLIDNRFIVDSVFTQAVLATGVGRHAKVVRVTHLTE